MVNDSVSSSRYGDIRFMDGFNTYASTAYLNAARVGAHNLAAIAFDAVSESKHPVFVSQERLGIAIGDNEFQVGDWIVRDVASDGTVNYRRPTEAEIRDFGLTTPDYSRG